jgi:hypothetical protein
MNNPLINERMIKMKNKRKSTFTINSINYVHNPTAAEKWFSIYLDMIKNEMTKQACKPSEES